MQTQLSHPKATKLLTVLSDDDNWDNDFATAISPSALQLPHLKPQDNFGGLLSSDRLKAFAFTGDSRNAPANCGDDIDGELLTIKAQRQEHDIDPQEQTLRPLPRKSSKTEEHIKSHQRNKLSVSKTATATVSGKPKSPTKSHFGAKFELPARPDIVYREQSVEDYSDLCVDNDNVFDRRVNNLMLKKVCSAGSCVPGLAWHSRGTHAVFTCREMRHSSSTRPTLRVYPGPWQRPSAGA